MASKTSENHELSLSTASIFHKIRKERDKRGYTQESMAHDLGITPKAYQNIETGKNKSITLERLQKIADIFEMDLVSLLQNDENVTQINGDNSDLSNSQIVNFYPSETALLHENEKLKIQLEAKNEEVKLLKKRISDLETMNELLVKK